MFEALLRLFQGWKSMRSGLQLLRMS